MIFAEQLARARANLERVEKLLAERPDLFSNASGIVIQEDYVRVYIHAGLKEHEQSWAVMASAHRDAQWKRDGSAAMNGYFDWRGTLGGVELVVMGAERRAQPSVVELMEVV